MKKIIALSLLALTLGTNVPSTANGMILFYPAKKAWTATKHAAKAVKEVALVGLDLVKGTLPIAIVAVTGVAIVCGIDFALAWANQIGLPATFFNHYTFGTLYSSVHGWVAPIVAVAPDFFENLPQRIKSLPELMQSAPEIIGSLPQTAKAMFDTYKFGQAAQQITSNITNLQTTYELGQTAQKSWICW